MAQYSDKKIMFIMGTLGSGKGTQADELSEVFGLYHFDTSAFLRRLFASDDPSIASERAEYESGKWVNPEFVVKMILEKIPEILTNYKGVVFSGSPRTIYEVENELPIFEDLVGSDNIKIFYLNIGDSESSKRSMGRLICEENKHSIPNLPEFEKIRTDGVCPKDGSKLIKKTLDNPEILKSRQAEHNNRTLPVVDYMRDHGYKVIEIDGEQSIKKVSEDIMKYLS